MGSWLITSTIAPRVRRSCALCFYLSYFCTLFKPRASPSEVVDRDREEPLVDSGLSRAQSVTMAAVNENRGSTMEALHRDSSAAKNSTHRVGANGESNTSNIPVTSGQFHLDVSSLTVTLRPRPIERTAKYRIGFRHINQDALDASTSIESFFDFVANYRLRRMPHKDSRWDKILR